VTFASQKADESGQSW